MASASVSGFASVRELGINITSTDSPFRLHRNRFFAEQIHRYAKISTCTQNRQNPNFTFPKYSKGREFRLRSSVELDQLFTSHGGEEMSQGLYKAIEEMETMKREPSDILGELNERLSVRELQLVLVYFAQDGRDSWCALEVFEWLKKENRVDGETMELMVSIMCSWVKKLIEEKHEVSDVVDLLVDMDCVGLKPSFSMIEKVISLYWEMTEKEGAVMFVKDVLRRGIDYSTDDSDGHKGGPAGYLAWKMMVEGNLIGAVKFVIDLRESGFDPSDYTYFIAMTAVVKEMNEFAKALRKLKGFSKSGLVAQLDVENVELIENYQSRLLADGERLSNWLIQNGSSSVLKMAHEKLLAMYICAGRGAEAERQLWEMKLTGKEADRDLYNIVLAICASQKEDGAISRLLTVLEASNSLHKKKTLSWLLRGYIKGGHFNDAADTIIRMLDLGLYPEYIDRAAVLHGLSKRVQQSVKIETYLTVCKRLSDANLVGPCLVYRYVNKYKLWIIQMM